MSPWNVSCWEANTSSPHNLCSVSEMFVSCAMQYCFWHNSFRTFSFKGQIQKWRRTLILSDEQKHQKHSSPVQGNLQGPNSSRHLPAEPCPLAPRKFSCRRVWRFTAHQMRNVGSFWMFGRWREFPVAVNCIGSAFTAWISSLQIWQEKNHRLNWNFKVLGKTLPTVNLHPGT